MFDRLSKNSTTAQEILRPLGAIAPLTKTAAIIDGVLAIDCNSEEDATELNFQQEAIAASVYTVRRTDAVAVGISYVSIGVKGRIIYEFPVKAPMSSTATAIAPTTPSLAEQILNMLRTNPAERAILFELWSWQGAAYLVRMADDVVVHATRDIAPTVAPDKIISDSPLKQFWEPDDLDAFKEAIVDVPQEDITWQARIADEYGNPTQEKYEMSGCVRLVQFKGHLCRLVKIKSCRPLSDRQAPD